jgi:predicted nucleic-acid-binding protein
MTSSGGGGSLDSNILLRLLLKDIPAQHDAVLKLFAKESSFNVADTAFIEIAFVLERHYRFSRRQILEAIQGLLDLSQIGGKASIQDALDIFLAHPGLSFEDCYLAADSKTKRAEPLWTFDRKLARQTPAAKLLS